MDVHEVRIHGHRVRYRATGDARDVLLLVHGIAGSSATWSEVGEDLGDRYTVVAPDLMGHGGSAKPRGDYSLGAYASGLRDLLAVLGHERVTIVGHSLGGGVALQFAYQFPERCERLVLVASGGLGPEVHLILRAAALPGAELLLPLMTDRRILDTGDRLNGLLRRIGLRTVVDAEHLWESYRSLASPDARKAFLHTLRGLIDPSGQRISAVDRLYLAAELPTMLVWGERDRIIPVAHGRAAAEVMPHSRLVTFPTAGHFPHRDAPRAFVRAVLDFMATTRPSPITPERWLRLLSASRAAVGLGGTGQADAGP